MIMKKKDQRIFMIIIIMIKMKMIQMKSSSGNHYDLLGGAGRACKHCPHASHTCQVGQKKIKNKSLKKNTC